MNNVINYPKNYLTSVICRVDFERDISDESINNVLSSKDILDIFPLGQKDLINENKNFSINPDSESLSTTKDTYVIRSRSDVTGKNKIIISKKHVLIEYNAYDTFETTKKHFMIIINTLLEAEPNLHLNRFGLRYINVFNSDKAKLFKNYFSDTINGLVNIKNISNMDISRALGTIEYVSEDIRLIMKYGDFNRNYPGILIKHDFVLDYDAFIVGSYGISDVFPQKLEKAHDMIQTAFEESITNSLRKAMGAK